jgi:Zn-dependent protease
MWRSWKLGSAFGIGIYVHWSFLLIPLFVVWSNWSAGGLALVPFLLLLVAGVFTCVVLHELGHALMARHFGIGTRDITLYPIGGVARLERLTEDPLEEVCIALAGPAVNLVLAIGLFSLALLLWSLGLPPESLLSTSSAAGLVGYLLASNIMLGVFNMIPAFPMDGGRVLRALLAMGLGQLRATEIAAPIGMVVAAVVGVALVLWTKDPLLILLVGFVMFAGRRELVALRYRDAQRRAAAVAAPAGGEILDVLPATEETGFSGFVWDGRARVWQVWRDGRRVSSFSAGSE